MSSHAYSAWLYEADKVKSVKFLFRVIVLTNKVFYAALFSVMLEARERGCF